MSRRQRDHHAAAERLRRSADSARALADGMEDADAELWQEVATILDQSAHLIDREPDADEPDPRDAGR